MALSLRPGISWSQVCLGRPNLASNLYLSTLSSVVWHRIVLVNPSKFPGLSTDTHRRPVPNKKVHLRTGLSSVRSFSCGGVCVNNTINNNTVSIGGKDGRVRATGILRTTSKGRWCETGLLYSGLHESSLSKFNNNNKTVLLINPPVRPFRSWEPSIKALYVKKTPAGREMSNNNNNLKVADLPVTPDSTKMKKSPSSGSDSPDSLGSPASSVKSLEKTSPQKLGVLLPLQREDMAPNERDQQPAWKINKEKSLKKTTDERKARCKFGKLLESIDTWPEYYLKKEIKDDRKGTKGGSVKSSCPQLNDKVSMWKGDITSLVIDAIVNAANESLMGGGGVDGAIHYASGKLLKQECMTLRPCPTGHAVITGGYELPAKYVIHTVGPRGEDSDKLKACYENSLNCLLKTELKSIAFPCVSTGIYGYPNDKAAEVVLKTVREWLEKNHEKVDRVIFCLFLEKDIRIYEEKMQQYFPIASSETGKAGEEEKEEKEEPKEKSEKEM